MSEEVKEKSRFNIIVLLLSLTGVILTLAGYIIGNAFYQGMLSAYGVGAVSFTPSTEELYLQAYYYLTFVWIDVIAYLADLVRLAESINLVNWLILLFVSLVVLLVFLFIVLKIVPHYRESVRSFIARVEKLYSFLKEELKKSTFLMAVSVGPLLLMVVWVFVPVNAHKAGVKLAEGSITSFLENGCVALKGKRWGNCKILRGKNGKVIYEGLLLAQVEGKVAFMTKEGSFVTEIPDGAVIESRLLPLEQNN